MQMPDILLLTRIGRLPKKKRKEDSPWLQDYNGGFSILAFCAGQSNINF